MPYTPSLIQTILSVPESHRFLRPKPLAARELGSERRETVRSLSIVGVGVLSGAVTSTRGP